MKVGDSVKIVASPYVHESLQPGKTGYIERVFFDLYYVIMDEQHTDGAGSLDWPFDKHELEVIA